MTGAPLHIVAIGAHPDDIELSMGGLSIRFARAGHRVTWIVATDGAAGSSALTPGPGQTLAGLREVEAHAAAHAAGAALETLGFPDSELAWTEVAASAIGERLRGPVPDLIVTHSNEDYHADHRAVARIVGDTAPLGVPVLRADTMLGLHFAPTLLVDISDVFDAKLDVLAQHASQAALGISEALHVWNRFRGLQSGARRFRHAEAYTIDRRLGSEAQRVLDRLGGYCFV
jgi:N-acetylglucosamine malate deacetylase 1